MSTNTKPSGTIGDTQKTMTISATSFRGCNRFSPSLKWWLGCLITSSVFRFHYHSEKVIGSRGFMQFMHEISERCTCISIISPSSSRQNLLQVCQVCFYLPPFSFIFYWIWRSKTNMYPSETNIAPKNDGWSWNTNFLLDPGLFSGAFAVSFRECISTVCCVISRCVFFFAEKHQFSSIRVDTRYFSTGPKMLVMIGQRPPQQRSF